jgi:hypothetical protein
MSENQRAVLAQRAGACLAALLIAAASTSAAYAAAPAGPGSLTGVWMSSSRTSTNAAGGTLGSLRTPERDRVQRPFDADWPPLQPWASEILEKRIKASQTGEPVTTTFVQCLPGIPAMLFGGPYPIQILENPGQVTMLFEEQNHYRIIYLNGKLPDDPDPTFLGHSVGHWEGDTLVVDTIALTERTPIDRVGTPHSDALRLKERYRRIAPDQLSVTVTLDDPKAFTRPWDVQLVYRPVAANVKMTEYICENNRD